MSRKEIIYPILLESSQYSKDSFWRNIFEDLAYGKPPYGTYISKNFLCCSYKKKEFSYKIEDRDAKQIHDEIYTLLSQKLGIMSPLEKIEKKSIFTNDMQKPRKTWCGIRKKNIKQLLIELYVTRMMTKHSLSVIQARYLLSIICVAIALKVILVDDIEFENGQIQNIKGVEFENQRVIFRKNMYQLKNQHNIPVNCGKKTMIENWEKYIKELTKMAEVCS